MQSTSKLRTPAAAYAAARSLAVSATVAQSVFTYLSARISGKFAGRVTSVGLRFKSLIASIRPESFKPSRIARLVIQYISQQNAARAIVWATKAQNASCSTCAFNAFKFMSDSLIVGAQS